MNSLPRQRLHNESNDFHCTKKRDCTQLIEKKHSVVCYVPSLLFSFPIIRKPGFLFSFLRANQNSEFRRRRTIGLSVFTVPCYPHKNSYVIITLVLVGSVFYFELNISDS